MRKGANIGAATVVNQTGAAMPDKYQSYMRSMMRSTAEAHGQDTIIQKNDTLYKWKRDPMIAEAMVDERVAIPNLIDTGKVLTFTAQEAQKWGYCDGLAESPDEVILRKVGLEVGPTPEMKPWHQFLQRKVDATETVKIGLVGKYVELQDAYKSIDESLLQAAIYNDRKLDLHLFHSEKLNDDNAAELLKDMDGILIAPGFGQRGIEGKFAALKYARENDVPCLGICLGMQCMVIEFARDVMGLTEANSTEMEPNTPYKVIDLMEEQKNVTNMGGSMRLGAYDCTLKKGSKAYEAYGQAHIQERHRHRFEFNSEYRDKFEAAGMMCVGENPESNLVEVVEIPALKWFVGVHNY